MKRITGILFLLYFLITIGFSQNTEEVRDSFVINKIDTARQEIKTSGVYNSFYHYDDILSSSSIEETTSIDATKALQSKVAGLSISANSYTPGASSRMILRGHRSFMNSNEPLILLNGLPIDNSEWNNTSGGTDQSNRLMDIDPNTIESIEVIKSIAARAKYGIVGGNGIISIKTKSGLNSRPRITFKSSIGVDHISQVPLLQNTYAQGRTIDGVPTYRGPESYERYSWGPKLSDLTYFEDSTYPFDKNGRLFPSFGDNLYPANAYDTYGFFQKGINTNQSLQITGGEKTFGYYLSASYNKQQGIIPTNEYKRYNLSGSLNWEISDHLSLRFDGLLTNSNSNRSNTGSNLNGIMLGLLRTPVSFDNTYGSQDALNDSSSYELVDGSQRSYNSGVYDNPYWSLNKNKHVDDVKRGIANLSGQYKLSNSSKLLFGIGTDRYSDLRTGGIDINLDRNMGSAYEREANYHSDNIDISAVYEMEPSSLLSIESTFGLNYNQNRTKYDLTEGTELRTSNNVTIDNLENLNTNNSLLENKRAGGVLSFDAKYSHYLKITGSLRHDFSNKFGENTNGFTSYGLGLGVSLIEMLSAFSKEKTNPLGLLVHASAGKFGNEFKSGNETGNYIDAQISGDGFISGSEVEGTEPNSIITNQNLSSERIRAFDVGFDITHDKSKLKLGMVYYYELSDGLIMREPISSSSGRQSLISNIGAMSNKGLNISLSAEPIDMDFFKWRLGVAFNKNDNRVTDLGREEELFLSGFTNVQSVAVLNQSYSSILGYGFMRNEEGEMIIDNDGFPLVDGIKKILGDPNPDWTMFINNKVQIGKKISLMGVVDVKKGGDMYCGTCGTLDYFGRSQRSADERGNSVIFDGVTELGMVNTKSVDLASPTGSQVDFYRVRYGFGGIGEMSVYDASWIRLRSISIKYDLTNILKIRAIEELSLSFYGENLVLITSYPGIDPETNLTGNSGGIGFDYYNNPGTKRFGFSLQASF